MPRSRRALLTTAAAALGCGTIASTAGCLTTPSTGSTAPTDSPTPTGRPDGSADGDSPAFRRWLPDPRDAPLHDGYGVRYFDVAGIRDARDAIHETAYARLEADMRRPVPTDLVDPADVDRTVAIDFVATIALGSFDPEAVGERITRDRPSAGSGSTRTPRTRTPTTPTRTPWAAPDRYRGFDLYGSETVYAVSDDVVLTVAPMREADARAYATAIIDAHAEASSGYADGNAYVASMFGLVDDPHALWCYPEATDGSTSRGFRTDSITGGLKAWQFGPETTRLTYANTYVDAETAASGELEAFIDANADRFGPYDGLDVRVEDRLAWTDGTVPTGEFDYLSAGGPGDGVHTPN